MVNEASEVFQNQCDIGSVFAYPCYEQAWAWVYVCL